MIAKPVAAPVPYTLQPSPYEGATVGRLDIPFGRDIAVKAGVRAGRIAGYDTLHDALLAARHLSKDPSQAVVVMQQTLLHGSLVGNATQTTHYWDHFAVTDREYNDSGDWSYRVGQRGERAFVQTNPAIAALVDDKATFVMDLSKGNRYPISGSGR